MSDLLTKELFEARDVLLVHHPKRWTLYDSNGVIERARTRRGLGGGSALYHPFPTMPIAESETREPDGLLLGRLTGHYGHFILESLSRTWAAVHPFGGHLPLYFVGRRPRQRLRDWQREILDFYGLTDRVRIIGRNTRFQSLLIPDPGLISQVGLNEEHAKFLGKYEAADVVPGRKLWLSRSGQRRRGVMNEEALEQILVEAGWTIFRPQDHSFLDQLNIFQSAERIAGFIGSAFHSLICLRRSQAKIDIFADRADWNFNFEMIAETCGLNQQIHVVDHQLVGEVRGELSRYRVDPTEVLGCLGVECSGIPGGDSELLQGPMSIELEKSEKLYFHHFPETACASLSYWLRSQFPAKEFCPEDDPLVIERIGREGLKEYRLFCGQLCGLPQKFFSRRIRSIIWMRDPVEMVGWIYQLGQSHNIQSVAFRWNERWNAAFQRMRELSLAEFIETDEAEAVIHNLQAKSIAGEFELSGDALIRAARQQMRVATFVGLASRMDESMLGLAATFGWLPTAPMELKAIDCGQGDIAPELAARIRQKNPADQALFREGTLRFERQMATVYTHLGFAEDPDRDVLRESVVRNHRLACLARWQDSGVVRSTRSGFLGGVDVNAPLSCWMGPEPWAEILFWIPSSDAFRIEVTVTRGIDPSSLESLRISLNGEALQESELTGDKVGMGQSGRIWHFDAEQEYAEQRAGELHELRLEVDEVRPLTSARSLAVGVLLCEIVLIFRGERIDFLEPTRTL